MLKSDFEEEAKNDLNMVLTKYTMQFVLTLRKGERLFITCILHLHNTNKPVLYQAILLNNKIAIKAVFPGTCEKTGDGKTILPANTQEKPGDVQQWNGRL